MKKTMPIAPVQRAMYQLLAATLTVPVYDAVPKKAQFPYVTLGEPTAKDTSSLGFQMWACTRTLHVWSRHEGQIEAAELLAQICSALTDDAAPLTVEGWQVLQVKQDDDTSIMDDPDGLTRHGEVRMRVVLAQKG
jgi:hypothetical protein